MIKTMLLFSQQFLFLKSYFDNDQTKRTPCSGAMRNLSYQAILWVSISSTGKVFYS